MRLVRVAILAVQLAMCVAGAPSSDAEGVTPEIRRAIAEDRHEAIEAVDPAGVKLEGQTCDVALCAAGNATLCCSDAAGYGCDKSSSSCKVWRSTCEQRVGHFCASGERCITKNTFKGVKSVCADPKASNILNWLMVSFMVLMLVTYVGVNKCQPMGSWPWKDWPALVLPRANPRQTGPTYGTVANDAEQQEAGLAPGQGKVARPLKPLDTPVFERQTSSRDGHRGMAARSHFFVSPEDAYENHGGSLITESSIRQGFARKVYGLLCAQLSLTVALCAFCSLHQPTRIGIIEHAMVLFWTSFVLALVSILALFKCKNRYPWNVLSFWVFTALMALQLSITCAIANESGKGTLLLIAGATTLVVFAVLTLLTWQSRVNFSWLGEMLFAALFGMLVWVVLKVLFPPGAQSPWSVFWNLLFVMIFCAFIVYDTDQIRSKYGPDDYMIAAIELYLDIINLFILFLELMSSGD